MCRTSSHSLPVLQGLVRTSDDSKVYLKLQYGILSGHRARSRKREVVEWNVLVKKATIECTAKNITVSTTHSEPRTFIFKKITMANTWLCALQKSQEWTLCQYYDVGDMLGSGGFALVCEAIHLSSGKPCAVKTIDTTLSRPGIEECNRAEIRSLTTLSHPNIIQASDVLFDDDAIHIAMPYMRGGSLSEYTLRHAPFSEEKARIIFRPLLNAVTYLHEKGVVHRDIKMSNLLCELDEWPPHIKLADFGISGFKNSDGDYLPTGSRCAPHYAELEKRDGRLSGPASDVWACGAILYRIIEGRYPFRCYLNSNRVEFCPLDFVDIKWKSVSKEMKAFIRLLLHEDPDQRPTAAEAVDNEWMKFDGSSLSSEELG